MLKKSKEQNLIVHTDKGYIYEIHTNYDADEIRTYTFCSTASDALPFTPEMFAQAATDLAEEVAYLTFTFINTQKRVYHIKRAEKWYGLFKFWLDDLDYGSFNTQYAAALGMPMYTNQFTAEDIMNDPLIVTRIILFNQFAEKVAMNIENNKNN
jgi:hypothetical protein